MFDIPRNHLLNAAGGKLTTSGLCATLRERSLRVERCDIYIYITTAAKRTWIESARSSRRAKSFGEGCGDQTICSQLSTALRGVKLPLLKDMLSEEFLRSGIPAHLLWVWDWAGLEQCGGRGRHAAPR